MKNKNHALVLLENGIHFSTIMNMSENQIKVLAEKFDKEESKEGITREKIVQDVIKVDPATAKKEMIPVKDGVAGLDASGNLVVKGGTTQTEGEMTEKAVSKQQQKIMGLALSVKRGDTPKSKVSKKVQDMAKKMSEKDLEDFAGTKHKGLPKKKKETKEDVKKLEENIMKLIESHLPPLTTKGELLKTIKNYKG